jgi:NAD/NADP transhydrogenase alpha subunit
MKVGVPSEISPGELRVAATPKTIKRLQKQGFEVYIQRGAGSKANFSDKEFEEAGAKLVNTAAEIYGQSDIVLKVKEPSTEEVELFVACTKSGITESIGGQESECCGDGCNSAYFTCSKNGRVIVYGQYSRISFGY